jgi:hypothetical protein
MITETIYDEEGTDEGKTCEVCGRTIKPDERWSMCDMCGSRMCSMCEAAVGPEDEPICEDCF